MAYVLSREVEAMKPRPRRGDFVVEARGLTVRYPQAHGLRDVDLSVAAGSFVLIGGPSGSGKSTLAHALMGLIPSTDSTEVRGHVSVGGLDPRRHSTAQLATRVGLVFQNPASQLFNGTVEEEVAFGPRNLGLPAEEVTRRVEQALEAAGCVHLRQRQVRHLSSGEQQRVTIAAVLSMRPTVLVLDEPTANLDAQGVELLVQTLVRLNRRFGITLVVIEHRLAPFVPHADRLVWLTGGRVVADGAPARTLARMQPALPSQPAPSPSTTDPLVTLRGVTVGYGDHLVLRDCSFTLYRRDFAALVGPNGAGKTTLARVLAGLLRPRRGRVIWHANGRGPRVGLLQQNPLHQLVCDTVEEEVLFGPRNLGMEGDENGEQVLAQTDLLSLRHRLIHSLSVGQQQRTALAAALSPHPALLILDEPTVGQDWGHLIRTMNFLRDSNRAGQTVLLITHDSRLVERYAGRVWEMTEGQVREC